jgi:hypothetical protein
VLDEHLEEPASLTVAKVGLRKKRLYNVDVGNGDYRILHKLANCCPAWP